MLATAGVALLVYSESSARRARSLSFGLESMSSVHEIVTSTKIPNGSPILAVLPESRRVSTDERRKPIWKVTISVVISHALKRAEQSVDGDSEESLCSSFGVVIMFD
jgi:hypothetical protein